MTLGSCYVTSISSSAGWKTPSPWDGRGHYGEVSYLLTLPPSRDTVKKNEELWAAYCQLLSKAASYCVCIADWQLCVPSHTHTHATDL